MNPDNVTEEFKRLFTKDMNRLTSKWKLKRISFLFIFSKIKNVGFYLLNILILFLVWDFSEKSSRGKVPRRSSSKWGGGGVVIITLYLKQKWELGLNVKDSGSVFGGWSGWV